MPYNQLVFTSSWSINLILIDWLIDLQVQADDAPWLSRTKELHHVPEVLLTTQVQSIKGIEWLSLYKNTPRASLKQKNWMRDSQPEAVLSTGGWRITGPLSTREAILQITEDVCELDPPTPYPQSIFVMGS